jgi:uncharacterized protein
MASKATTKRARTVAKALVVRGGWDGHEPVQFSNRLVPWLKMRGFEVVVSDSMDAYADPAVLAGLRVIIPIWTMGEISGDQFNALNAAVRSGVGLAGWHGGMCDSFRNNTEYQFMTGGQWVAHPGGVIDYQVTDLDPVDPITADLAPFWMHSEQYYMHTDPGNEVLASTVFSGEHQGYTWIKGTRMPMVWKRTWGKGRVFYSALGHVAVDWDVPQAFEIMKRGIQWAAGLEIVPEFTDPSAACCPF